MFYERKDIFEMKMIKIGVLCPSEIAYRRFMPALKKIDILEFVGVGVATNSEFGIQNNPNECVKSEIEKGEKFLDTYPGKMFRGYQELINSPLIDAVYIPLPPGLHYLWAKKALLAGKHVLIEKPSTTTFFETCELIKLAREKNIALHENYMFNFHSQIDEIERIISENEIGDVRLYTIRFGFPFRGNNDFRYNKDLGGGALLDCGGYTIKLADRLLSYNSRIVSSVLNYDDRFEVDLYGSAMLKNDKNVVVQISFGMDNDYKCELEVWGSKGTLFTNRILTAPDGFEPTVIIKKQNEKKETKLLPDDTFMKSLLYFIDCINDLNIREKSYINIERQALLVQNFLEGKNGD